MSQKNLWNRVLACSEAIARTSNPERCSALINLREQWTALANQSFVDDEAVETLEKIHTNVICQDKPATGGAQVLPLNGRATPGRSNNKATPQ